MFSMDTLIVDNLLSQDRHNTWTTVEPDNVTTSADLNLTRNNLNNDGFMSF